MKPTREPATHTGQTYFVTSTTWERRQVFQTERWAQLFVDTLFHYRNKAYLLHEFVLMPDHFHLLITPLTSLEKAVQFIKGGFSHRAKVELASNMEIWQRGFSDHRIRNWEDYEQHVQYIYKNPVRVRLVERPEDYRYCSAGPGLDLDPVPQGLKPLIFGQPDGTAEAVPFQSHALQGEIPQGLKPPIFGQPDGTAEAVPFQSDALQSDALQSHALQSHALQGHALQSHALQGHALQDQAPQNQAIQSQGLLLQIQKSPLHDQKLSGGSEAQPNGRAGEKDVA